MNWLARLRAPVAIVFNFIYTFSLATLMILAGLFGAHGLQDWILSTWGRGILWFSGVSYSVKGLEKLPRQTGVLVLFNHQSFMDIFLIFAIFRHRLRFGAKIELFKIPLFGLAMRSCGILPIARQDRRQVLKIYEDVKSKFRDGWSFALAPEGTRQINDEIGVFKKGPFIFAVNAQANIVPVVIRGARLAWRKGSMLPNADRWRRHITIEVLPPVSTQDYTLDTVPALVELVRNQMTASYSSLPA